MYFFTILSYSQRNLHYSPINNDDNREKPDKFIENSRLPLMLEGMDISPKELAAWLKSSINWDRHKFAKELGVSVRTTYNWTSASQPIPLKHINKIAWMMKEDAATEVKDCISLNFSDEEWTAICEFMKNYKKPVIDFINSALRHAVQDSETPQIPPVAEESSFNFVSRVAEGAPKSYGVD